ncbi:histidine phosphatase family protein [Oceaniglobus trochenteri]|uniref:histidine phosphatase family protein n=1 Tax=Oceaniglobus trochenteri TaxID=2763260 RepID=UPI001CFFDC3A|nr:histidine phosphatase family protein [Oceaniglobus trochenteri]
MSFLVRYLTHPQVAIDPQGDITRWSLSDLGRARVGALVRSGALQGTTRIVSSDETKAVETATPLAEALGLNVEIRANLHENDRSATGFLPPAEFEATADRFFAHPDDSIRGWETARAAQARIVGAVERCLADHRGGDLLLVGHGAVGTLLYCALAGLDISRKHDQGPGGGGCFLAFDSDQRRPKAGWQPMEAMAPAPRA